LACALEFHESYGALPFFLGQSLHYFLVGGLCYESSDLGGKLKLNFENWWDFGVEVKSS